MSCGCAQHIKRTIDISGRIYGKLTALHRDNSEHTKDRKVMWVCQCKCGNIVSVLKTNLISGNTRSCGCIDDRVNTKPVSQQQRKLQEMLGGELNHKFNTYYIDLVLSDGPLPVAIEYDSHYWHHDTRERDLAKSQQFIAGGFKVLRIKGVYKVPTAEELQSSLNRLYTTNSLYEEIVLSDWEKREAA